MRINLTKRTQAMVENLGINISVAAVEKKKELKEATVGKGLKGPNQRKRFS